jgi:hypothetical protein
MHFARRAEQLDDPHLMRRFTRLALGFSKKVENLAAATAIHVAVYNFCRMHGSLKCTPAMAAGVIDKL